MKNKTSLTLFILILIPFFGFSQLRYDRVKIYATNTELAEISNLGVTIDHGEHKDNQWFIAELSVLEIELLEDNGFAYDILIEDMSTFYAEKNWDSFSSGEREDCPDVTGGGDTPPTVPENFNLGSMGGYYTYEEYLNELDEMRAAYPELITEKEGISDFETWESRPIHWVKISDNPETDEDEPEILYTAIHHAREPMSLSQTIFYMWYLLENYGANDEVTYLVDHTEMYFVPMINPDGYKYNHTISPDGGGMHRKNRNPSVGELNKGVDLNRNYGYHWNEAGTSSSEYGDTYAGESAFSEPETQAIKWFCENHEFAFAFNAHAHGGLLLFPFGWSTSAFADDHDYFQAYTNHQAIFNHYVAQKATELYAAAGDSDDWMYADDLDVKPSVFAVTPEVGTSFWPSVSAIEPTCQGMVWSNLILAHLAHVYGHSTDIEEYRINETSGYFNYTIERLGLQDGDIIVSITPLEGIETMGGANTHVLTLAEKEEDSISFELVSDIAFGDEIKYVIHTNNGLWERQDTIIKAFGIGTNLFFDDCEDLTNWEGDWDETNEQYFSPTTSITDSPYDGTYGNNVNKEIRLIKIFDLEHATYCFVNFQAKWEIENDYDFVEFMISVNEGSSWQPLCGQFTNTGVADQDLGKPLYDGMQFVWVKEEIDLSDYIGESNVRFKFRLITDGGAQEDGFYFDDFSVITDGDFNLVGINEQDEIANTIQIYPNPANTEINIVIDAPTNTIQNIIFTDELGRIVKTIDGNTTKIQISDLAEGFYYIQFMNGEKTIQTKRFTIIR